MAQNAIRPHIETIVSSYLNTVKNADKAALEKPFTIENDAEFVHNVEQLIASSYMLGIYHADEETGKNVNAADTDIPPIPFTEAVNFLKGKVPMTTKEWSSLEPKMRFRAFTVAKLGSAKTIDVARQQLIGALEDGSGYAETWQRIKDTLQDEAKSLTPGYWENVFRTNTQSAYIAGKLEQYEKNGVAAYQLMVIEDDRTSKICRNLLNNATGYGLILPVNHTFWKTYGFPPYHYQCRTSIRGLTKNQIGNDGNNVDNLSMNEFRRRQFKPMDGFGGNPLDKGNWWMLTPQQMEQAIKYGCLSEFNRMDNIFADYDSVWKGYTRYEGENGGWYDLCSNPPNDWYTDNKPIVELLAKNGYKIKVIPALENISNKYKIRWSNPDIIINGFLSDIKNVNTSIVSRLRSAKNQKLRNIVINIPSSFSISEIEKTFDDWSHGTLNVIWIYNNKINTSVLK